MIFVPLTLQVGDFARIFATALDTELRKAVKDRPKKTAALTRREFLPFLLGLQRI